MREEIGFRVKQARENANLTQEKQYLPDYVKLFHQHFNK